MKRSAMKFLLGTLFFMYWIMFVGIFTVTSLRNNIAGLIIVSAIVGLLADFFTYWCLINFSGLDLKEAQITKRDYISEEFKEIYAKLFKENIKKDVFEKQNDKNYFKLVVSVFIICILLMFISIIVLPPEARNDENPLIFECLVGGTVIIVTGYLLRKNKDVKEIDYKEEIIKPFVTMVNPNLKYYGTNIDFREIWNEYIESDFDLENSDKIMCDDYIEGLLEDKTIIKMCEINSKRVENVIENGKKTEKIYELFKGIFAYIESDKFVNDTIRICLNNSVAHILKNRIEIGIMKFEKIFDVYADDKIQAMSVLNVELIDIILDFYDKYGIDFEIIFKNNKIYFRFFTEEMFEAQYYYGEKRQKAFNYYYSIIKFVVEITEKISDIQNTNEI